MAKRKLFDALAGHARDAVESEVPVAAPYPGARSLGMDPDRRRSLSPPQSSASEPVIAELAKFVHDDVEIVLRIPAGEVRNIHQVNQQPGAFDVL